MKVYLHCNFSDKAYQYLDDKILILTKTVSSDPMATYNMEIVFNMQMAILCSLGQFYYDLNI